MLRWPTGWRGWSCTDNSTAQTLAQQKVATLLLTLSNLLFLAPIAISVHRCLLVEASVYAYTMFFSTVCGAISVCTKSFAVVGEGLRFHHGPPGFGAVSLRCSLQQGFPAAPYHGMHRARSFL